VQVQTRRLVDGIHDALRDNVIGVYLHGSAVLGGLQPRSDIDVIAVTARRTSSDDKQLLVDLLLALSGRGG